MLEVLKDLWKTATSEGGVVSGAPWLFLSSVVFLSALFAIAMWTALGWAYASKFDGQTSTISSLQDRLKLRDDQITDYKDKLNGATPEEARARIATLEMQVQQLMPRHLTTEQQATIVRLLRSSVGRVSIVQDMAVPDARQIAADFAAAFHSAGWQTSSPMVMGPGNVPPSGIALRVGNPSSLSPIEAEVRQALVAANITFDLQGGARYDRDFGFDTLNRDAQAPAPTVEMLITSRSNRAIDR